MANGLAMLLGGTLALSTSLMFDARPLVTDIIPFAIMLAAAIFVSNILGHNMYGSLLKRYSPTFLSLAGFLVPMFNALLDWQWRGYQITWHFLLASVVVFTGLYVFYQDETNIRRVVA